MLKTYDWQFPLPRTHTGMLLGNATMGIMIWGGRNQLNLTLNRADFWDHRGGKPWTAAMNYRAIRRLLEAGDEAGLRASFEGAQPDSGTPARPSLLPFGRLELEFPAGLTLDTGTLAFATGVITIRLCDRRGRAQKLTLSLAMDEPLLAMKLSSALPVIRRVPAWNFVGEYLRSISFVEPVLFAAGELTGWEQARPADPTLCAGYRVDRGVLWVGLEYGREKLTRSLAAAVRRGANALQRGSARWWRDYWKDVPVIELPNERLQFLYQYGMYKFAGISNPAGVPSGLQGPWVEEYQMPPWSGDYHFNINVQECYWPAYQGNQLEHLRPLFDMIWGWREQLRENARLFLGIDDGLMLPHAVDDRGTNMGGFWTGTIDHGCTAWVAKMMWDYWRYGGDRAFLRRVAWPFMVGAMRVYEELLERDGDKFALPVSVSPEYRGKAMNAWGRNASFQLACIHWLIEALQEAAAVLGEKPRPIWAQIQRGLPRACLAGNKPKIMLWEDTDLEESHRHHSHLAGIYPFDVLAPDDPALPHSIRHWVDKGMGRWTGWCMPWAAMLHTRAGNAEMTELTLELWQRVFTNEGHGTLHDYRFAGFSVMGVPGKAEIMQIEAGLAATAAVMDALVHVRRGVHYLLPGAPKHWRNLRFRQIRTAGGFLVSATRYEGDLREVLVRSELGNRFRMRNPWTGEAVDLPTRKGQQLQFTARGALTADR